MKLRVLILPALLVAACTAPAAITSSPTPSPSVAAGTPTVNATAAPGSTSAPTPAFAASECTSATATTRQVIERYFALSTSNSVQAVTDCFAKVWRDRTASFSDGAALWSRSGPATSVVITFGDAVNGCDRFSVSAQMSNSAFRVPPFFSVGAEGGRARIYETSTALATASSTSLRCG